MKEIKVLIIENQQREFEKTRIELEKYEVPPKYKVLYVIHNESNDKFTNLATKFRIWVNERYGKKYREKALNYILGLAKEADIIIMDYIIGGSHNCLTGIDLAEELVKKIKEEKGKVLPVLFLSKDKQVDRHKEYEKFIKNLCGETDISLMTRWITKGYSSDEILQSEYIKKHVIEDGIEKMLGKERSKKNAEGIHDFLKGE